MPIQGLDHINIHTSKREETLRVYTEMLDFQEGFRPPLIFRELGSMPENER